MKDSIIARIIYLHKVASEAALKTAFLATCIDEKNDIAVKKHTKLIKRADKIQGLVTGFAINACKADEDEIEDLLDFFEGEMADALDNWNREAEKLCKYFDNIKEEDEEKSECECGYH